MKATVYGIDGSKKSETSLGRAFSADVRPDLIKKAVLYEQSLMRQAYGADPEAGKRTSAHYHGRRDVRHTMMNREMARMKRIHTAGILHMRARFVPQAVKGRKAHPPKAEKVWEIRMNRKEWERALKSAVAASCSIEAVKERGHRIDSAPILVEDRLQGLKKNKEVLEALNKLGLEKELERSKETKIRAGKGTMRGRKTLRKKGPLIIISEDKGICRAGRNIPGVEIVPVKELMVEDLAPGTHPGRVTVWTESAASNF